MAKERIIAEAFYDEKNGFGSVQHTLTRAKLKDPSITRADVKAFLDNQEVKQRRKPLKVNSFVADLPRQEFQVDLADFGAEANPRYCFVAIDIFSKKVFAMPLRAKSDAPRAVQPMFEELGYPISVMSDEGGEFHGQFGTKLHADLVEQIFSRTGGRFVERVIRTLKMALHLRTEVFDRSWSSFLQDVVDQYNDRVHTATEESPNLVAENEYHQPTLETVHANLLKHAKFPVKHPDIAVGDWVKIRIKPSGYGQYKETFNSWSVQVYKVLSIDNTSDGGPRYRLEGYARPLLRFELKKVNDVQRPNLVRGKLASEGPAVHSRLPGAEPPPHPLAAPRPHRGPMLEPPEEIYGREGYGGSSGSSGANSRQEQPIIRRRPVSAPVVLPPPRRLTAAERLAAEANRILNVPYHGNSSLANTGRTRASTRGQS